MTGATSTAGFTKGPWVGFADGGDLVAIMPAGRAGKLCSFNAPPSDADGRLMIAAPDLYEALAECRRVLNIAKGHFNNDSGVRKDGNAAIAAADLALSKAVKP